MCGSILIAISFYETIRMFDSALEDGQKTYIIQAWVCELSRELVRQC
jgi:hypothetical protein